MLCRSQERRAESTRLGVIAHDFDQDEWERMKKLRDRFIFFCIVQ